MSLYLGKKISSHFRYFAICSPINKLLHFQYNNISSSSAISPVTDSSSQDSFKVSYLINSCGLSPKHALSVSKVLNLKTTENADLVIAFFKKHGFTDTQISNIVRKIPWILSSNCEKTILPKLEYFASVGFSSEVLTNFVAASPHVLKMSLDNGIIPIWSFFKSVLITDEKTNLAAKRFLKSQWRCDIEARMIPNIKILREFGVEGATLLSLLTGRSSVLKTHNDMFRTTVEKVKQMGFNPQRINFVLAVHALLSMSNSTWDKKVDVLKKWGWSEDDVYVAFSKNPWFMTVSENKMSSTMDMVINKSGFDHSDVVNWPSCLTHSFAKRVVPRCLFYHVLLERELIMGKWNLSILLGYSDERFMERFTKLYKEDAPELLKLYQEKLKCVTNGGLEMQREQHQLDCNEEVPPPAL